MKKNISIILAPFGVGGPNNAACNGPKALMENHLVEDLKELGFNVKIIKPGRDVINHVSTHKQLNPKNKIKNIDAVVKINKWLASTVRSEIKNGFIPLTIGGDHSLAIGTISGVVAGFKPATTKNVGVLWIDRHFDAHSPKNTPSWRAHGMPVSVATADRKYDLHPDFQKLLAITPHVPKIRPENFVQIGIGEKSCIKPNTKWYSMEDIDDRGINKIVDGALNYLLKRVKYIYIAWDIDSMNITGTGTSGDSQLTLREGLVIARAINKRIRLANRLAGFEIMEVAPRLERKHLKGQTVDWAIQLITTSFGGNLFNNLSRLKRNIKV
ncbi:MAG: arginase family protein [Candidatus Melainabacteria bacterium]|nr:arginase family protein [Candidatus Melainabacteria bacterium]